MKFQAVIPARYASTRFPGKPLAVLGGKTMIQRVWERVSDVIADAVVATDDLRIADAVKSFGGRAVMTSENHRSGTDRCAEVASGSDADVIINIQGDEPFIDLEQIKAVMDCFSDPHTQIATLVRQFDPAAGFEALFDPNLVKVVIDDNGFAMYFSRSIIPYVRGVEWQNWLDSATYYSHIGLYAYRRDVLLELARLPQSSLEKAESLEQLRWLQNGYRIKVAQSDSPTIGIDTPEDLEAAEKYLDTLK
ncbi:MAG: 3-deoxy-manno-octulosonate cytidylyltransferase [Muribaculaceae bacterium]|nr:3-deoxy-manno-octulosonate cytidylyltransferase [Muribaculaceae bacterium]MDE5930835.1 3-deoxy-manno-octulosonate cytidylyltransferase [Muribaculaceae bacterium]